MCQTCGCSGDGEATLHDLQAGERETPHEHDHAHEHDHDHARPEVVRIERALMARNDSVASENRRWLAERGILALNVLGSPGCGKTTLLERTIRSQPGATPVFVLEGDQATSRDAERVRAAGARAVQINTGVACHLDAEMVRRGLARLDPPPGALVLIENVGNLVCPALFDLGQAARVVVTSVTEGEDKPVKYPHMFRSADHVVLNKIDLAPHTQFDEVAFAAALSEVNPGVGVARVSATRGDGLHDWSRWIGQRRDVAPTGTGLVGR